jgi:anti-sigma regulatory factor (Ser/Thr protein kinase)
VSDEAPSDDGPDAGGIEDLAETADLDDDAVPPGVGLAVITGLVDDVSVEPAQAEGQGVVVRMSWPTSA